AEDVGHLTGQAGADQRPRTGTVQPRGPQRVQSGLLQQREYDPDQRQLRQGHDSEQPAAGNPAGVEDGVLIRATAAAVLLALGAGAGVGTYGAADAISIRTLSSRPDRISGGDVLVEI